MIYLKISYRDSNQRVLYRIAPLILGRTATRVPGRIAPLILYRIAPLMIVWDGIETCISHKNN